MELTFSLDDLPAAASFILANAQHRILLFDAEMGVGKTTLIRELVFQLGGGRVGGSPTFSIVNEYEIANGAAAYHFDLYRLKSEAEALDFGIEEYFYSGSYCFIEWPDKTPNLIPNSNTLISIELLENGDRKLQIRN
ncbi:tRNA (adenosine(37)-N6)-threonylcarbamoyltransferase complex ATPase subunit type 1 TsaE [Flavobacterium aurantiibacter]|uniref:tRNA threonylcarbamoyladenosine biosynthesis protein TsaE n=1 Tax=Flavobacterium aurantiibacter TaxID=2023067 RepID=A0A256A4M0_9FLAO|nr:tRNA (adenosine(37)-N6)-threonylcarbamoyltransferase complex ATPase subunit type 1 TsaE [Flavobacterium aurantiibacter]OYQ48653.1 tRNA (adenosine(37)-N6)-threonylcarbamoyltransferase complex ATPase subunit type 1 TsaE [Flavobacterium aurantiibacter]